MESRSRKRKSKSSVVKDASSAKKAPKLSHKLPQKLDPQSKEKAVVGNQSASHGILKLPTHHLSLQSKISNSLDSGAFSARHIPQERYEIPGSGENTLSGKDILIGRTKTLIKKVSSTKSQKERKAFSPEKPGGKGAGENTSDAHGQHKIKNKQRKSSEYLIPEIEDPEYLFPSGRIGDSDGIIISKKTSKRKPSSKLNVVTKTSQLSKPKVEVAIEVPPPVKEVARKEEPRRHSTESAPESAFTDCLNTTEGMQIIDTASLASSQRTLGSAISKYSIYSSDISIGHYSTDTQYQAAVVPQPQAADTASVISVGRRPNWIPPRSVASMLRSGLTRRDGRRTWSAAIGSGKGSANGLPPPLKESLTDAPLEQPALFTARGHSNIGSCLEPPKTQGSARRFKEPVSAALRCDNESPRHASASPYVHDLQGSDRNERGTMRQYAQGVRSRVNSTSATSDSSRRSAGSAFAYNRIGRVTRTPSFTYTSTIHATHKKCPVHNEYSGPLKYQFRFRSPRPCLCRGHLSRRERPRAHESEEAPSEPPPPPPRVTQRYSHTFRFKRPANQGNSNASHFFFIGTESLMAPDRYRGTVSGTEGNPLPKYSSSLLAPPADTETLWSRDASSNRSKAMSRSSNESIAGSAAGWTDDADSEAQERTLGALRPFPAKDRGAPSQKWLLRMR